MTTETKKPVMTNAGKFSTRPPVDLITQAVACCGMGIGRGSGSNIGTSVSFFLADF
jgi:hypothetical protein